VASATVFEPLIGENNWDTDIQHISTAKFIGTDGLLSTPLPMGTKTTLGRTAAGGKVYGVVENPYNVNSCFPNIKKTMLMLPHRNTSGVGAREELFRYSVSGLNPAKQYEIVVEGYFLTCGLPVTDGYVPGGTPTLQVDFGKDTNGNDIGGGNLSFTPAWVDPRGQNPVICFTMKRTFKPSTYSLGTAFDMVFRTDYNGFGGSAPYIAYGLTKVEIKGTAASAATVPALIPKIISSQGAEVCRNELVRFSLDRKYDACTYKWEKSANGISGWTMVGDRQNYLEEISQSAFYRCTINEGRAGGYGVSNVFELTVVECCNEENGGSRITLLHDDFGEFLSDALYRTVDGRIISTCNGQRKTIMGNSCRAK
jgi:hypothetical protein